MSLPICSFEESLPFLLFGCNTRYDLSRAPQTKTLTPALWLCENWKKTKNSLIVFDIFMKNMAVLKDKSKEDLQGQGRGV